MRVHEVLNIQNLGARVTVLGDCNDPIYAYFNPSIAFDGKGKLRINIRSCNWGVNVYGGYYYRNGKQYAHTKNLYGYINPDTLEVTDLKEVLHSANTPKEISEISGIEDVRLFWRKDGMHFSGVRTDTRPMYRYPAQQCEFVYDEPTNTLKYLRTMFSPSPARQEKNWMPTDKPSDVFEFNYSPTQVYKTTRVHGDRYDGFIHGGSQLLWQPKTKRYLAIVHSKHFNPLVVGKAYDNMVYVHYFAEYNQEGLLIRISEPFTFGIEDQIQFAAGMVEHKGSLLVSVGVGDARFALALIKKDIVMSMLTKYTGIEVNPIPPVTRAQQRYIDLKGRELRNAQLRR